jgi:hypothetical protein
MPHRTSENLPRGRDIWNLSAPHLDTAPLTTNPTSPLKPSSSQKTASPCLRLVGKTRIAAPDILSDEALTAPDPSVAATAAPINTAESDKVSPE